MKFQNSLCALALMFFGVCCTGPATPVREVVIEKSRESLYQEPAMSVSHSMFPYAMGIKFEELFGDAEIHQVRIELENGYIKDRELNDRIMGILQKEPNFAKCKGYGKIQYFRDNYWYFREVVRIYSPAGDYVDIGIVEFNSGACQIIRSVEDMCRCFIDEKGLVIDRASEVMKQCVSSQTGVPKSKLKFMQKSRGDCSNYHCIFGTDKYIDCYVENYQFRAKFLGINRGCELSFRFETKELEYSLPKTIVELGDFLDLSPAHERDCRLRLHTFPGLYENRSCVAMSEYLPLNRENIINLARCLLDMYDAGELELETIDLRCVIDRFNTDYRA